MPSSSRASGSGKMQRVLIAHHDDRFRSEADIGVAPHHHAEAAEQIGALLCVSRRVMPLRK
jgi:hypothetical protein